MSFELETAQIDSYQRDGYLFPLDVFDAEQVTTILAELDQAREDAIAKGLEAGFDRLLRANTHYLLPFVCETARSPQLLDRVQSILGPDLLLWSAEFFIKRASTDKIVSWHQDLTYWGLGETDDEITAWVALSEVTVESGCMRFLAGSHQHKLLPHRDTFDADNLLSRGQEVAVEVDENDSVNVILKAGQVSLHHGRIFHASGPNRSAQDRIGLVFRYLTPSVRQLVSKRDYAMMMRGIDSVGNWIHVAPPTRNFDTADLSLHEKIKQDQSAALAEGANQQLHAAY